jgi:pimeloyl-ACP methyl ester carboxylesterase
MAIANLDGDRVYYRLEGAAGRPVVALSHSLGLDHTMWDPQIAALTARFRVLRYDLRGHGGSDATPGDYTVEQLGRDALALLDRLGLDRVAWCGVSLGGMVGQWLAAHADDRLSSLVLANTSAAHRRFRPAWRRGGAPCSRAAPARSSTPPWRVSSGRRASPPTPPRIASARETLLATDPVGATPAAARRCATSTARRSCRGSPRGRWS